jgi:hypothetical protein
MLAPSILGHSWTKGEPQEVKLLICVTPTPVRILAVNKFRFLRMKLQIALPQSLSNAYFQILRFRLRHAVHNDVIRVALKWDFWVSPSHPVIKSIVQKEIGQQWANHTSLGSSLAPLDQGSIR